MDLSAKFMPGSKAQPLEGVLRRKLQNARVTPAGGCRIGAGGDGNIGRNFAEDRTVQRQIRGCRIQVVGHVKRLETNLQLVPFPDREGSRETHVQLDGPWKQDIAQAQVSKRAVGDGSERRS